MSNITNNVLQCYSLFQMVSRRGGCVSVSRVDGREPGWRWRDQRERSSTLFRKRMGAISKSSSSLVQMAKYVPCGILIAPPPPPPPPLLLLLPLRVVVLVVLWGVLLVMAYKVFTMEREYTEYDPYSILELDSVRHLSDRNALAAFSLSLSLFLPTLTHSPLFFFLFSSFPPPSFPCLHPPLYRALQWEKLESSIGN